MRIPRLVAAVAGAAIAVTTVTSPASSADSLAGRWDSDSLRDNRIGYYLEVTAVPGSTDAYVGTLKFAFRDGRRGSTTPIRMTTDGEQVRITARTGSFDRSAGVLRGRLDASGRTLTLTNCQARLRLVMANALDSDCVFRPAR